MVRAATIADGCDALQSQTTPRRRRAREASLTSVSGALGPPRRAARDGPPGGHRRRRRPRLGRLVGGPGHLRGRRDVRSVQRRTPRPAARGALARTRPAGLVVVDGPAAYVAAVDEPAAVDRRGHRLSGEPLPDPVRPSLPAAHDVAGLAGRLAVRQPGAARRACLRLHGVEIATRLTGDLPAPRRRPGRSPARSRAPDGRVGHAAPRTRPRT